ncbi:MAG TPA: tetratricopeptide repeat protein [Myxococcota bacterium]|jgi:hypothetical protein|nr:tetratricopeptide repeat protein [Myxococcota bacterium]
MARRRPAALVLALAAILAVALAGAGCPFDPRARGDLFSAGMGFQRSGDFATAALMFRKVLAAHPDDAAAWRRLGECEAAQGRVAEATAAFVRWVELEPGRLGDARVRLAALGVDPAVVDNRAGAGSVPARKRPSGAAVPLAAGDRAEHPPLSGKTVTPDVLGDRAPRGTYYPGGALAPGGVLGAILPSRLDRSLVAYAAKGPVLAVALDAGGTRAAHGLPRGGLRLVPFGAEAPAVEVHAGEGTPVRAAAFAAEADRVVWGTAAGRLRVSDGRGARIADVDAHEGAVRAVAIDADAERVYSGGDDGVLRTWTVAGERLDRAIDLGAVPTALGLSPGSRYLAVALEDGRVLVLDPLSGAPEVTLRDFAVRATGAAFTADGRFLVTSSWDGTARVYQTGSWESAGVHVLHPDVITSLAAGARVAVTASADCRLKVWEAASGAELVQLPGHTTEVESVAVSLDGRRLASVDYAGALRFWELR